MNTAPLPPAQLFVGDKNQITAHAEELLQKHFCKQKSDGCFCAECRRIKQRQHPSITWISPEKDYTLDDVEIIFERSRFALDPNTQYFFVLDNAQTLTTATANRILKVVEEPPTGYHFLLLTTNREAIVPTIASRCLITDLGEQVTNASDLMPPLLGYFIDAHKHNDVFGFEQELKKLSLSDTQSAELLQSMIAYITKQLHAQYANQTSGGEKQAYFATVLNFLLTKMRKPPQSGSSDIFWKHVFLNAPRE